MPDVDVRSRRIDAELDAQRPSLSQFPLELTLREDVDSVPSELIDGRHASRF
jgi:hypothetical protein